MAKIIKYKLVNEVNHGTEENPKYEQIFRNAEIVCPTEADLEANLPIVQAEAYNGEYTIEDDGQTAPAATLEDRVGDLEADTSDLAEALNMILEGVVE